MPEFFSGFGIAVAMMTETCRQFKRIDFRKEKRCVDFLLAKFRFKHCTDCNANQLGIPLGRDITPRFEGAPLVLQARSDSSGLLLNKSFHFPPICCDCVAVFQLFCRVVGRLRRI